MDQHDRAAACQAIYRDTQAFYDEIRPQLRAEADLGYEILYGPPVHKPPVLFLGLQPGGSVAGPAWDGTTPPWPEVCEYATADWPLARRLQQIYGAALLAECTGLNALFVRSPDYTTYKATVPGTLRARIQRFCLEQTLRLIDLLEPRSIVVLGLGTLELFGKSELVLANTENRWLVSAGRIGTHPAIATLHPTGARMTAADRAQIEEYLRSRR